MRRLAASILSLAVVALLATANPISRAEYNRIRDEKTGIQWGNMALALAVLALVAAGIVILVRSRRARRSRPSFQP